MKKGKMLILVGESGSGKSSIQEALSREFNVKKVVTYTTRPMRKGEIDGVSYHFVSEEKFQEMIRNGAFAEHASYRDWYYGTALEDCGFANTSAALTPAGLRALSRLGVPNVSFYLDVDRRSRLIKILERGDNIEEAYRRSLSDVGQFDGVSNEVSFRIENSGYRVSPKDLTYKIMNLYSAKLREEQLS